MKCRVAGVVIMGLVLAVGWLGWQTPRAASQAGGGEPVKAGRFLYVSSGTTVVRIDTETGKTYALTAHHSYDGIPEYAWVPIHKFEDVESYRSWAQRRRFPGAGAFTTTTTGRPFFGTTTTTGRFFPITTTTAKFFGTTTGFKGPIRPLTTTTGVKIGKAASPEADRVRGQVR